MIIFGGLVSMENDDHEIYDLPLTILENERSRITRELHDITIQNLVHTIHQTELISHYMDEDPVNAKLELSLLSKNLKETISDIRNIIYDLKPMAINDLGFTDALDEYLNYLKSVSNIHFEYHIEDELDHLTDSELLIIFRILQEVCNNAVKHSEASHVTIKMCIYQNKYYQIKIDDDGVGCHKEDLHKMNHYGLEILRERVGILSGTYQIETDIDKGFHITIIVPVTC